MDQGLRQQVADDGGDAPPPWFSRAVIDMLGNYINTTIGSVTLKSWWMSVRHLPEHAIRRALVLAPRESDSPIFPPSGELVRRIAEREAKVAPPTRPNLSLARLPAPNDGRTLPEDNPFMMLARSWEEESRRLRLDPDKPTPSEIGDRRIRELNALLDGKFEF